MNASLHHISEQIRAATASSTPLRIRGGGSKDFYGVPTRGELLDTRPLRGITRYEPSELVITAQAGTPLTELEAVLAERGQCLPFEPPHFHFPGRPEQVEGTATVGGMVSAGLSGPSRASVGSVRDYVLGAQLLNGRGEHLSFGGQVMKNVAGYDVSRLLAGAMGTLGVVTEVSLKVLPVAPAEATLVFELPQARALAQLHRWGGQPLPLNASCWVCDDSQTTTRELLFVRLRGAVAAVASACSRMLADVPGTQMDTAQAATDWRACRDQRLPFFTQPAPDHVLWRLSLAQTASVLEVPWPQLVEWHGGLRWLWAPASEADRLHRLAADHGGHATIFIASESINTRATRRFSSLMPPLDRIHRRLCAEFDPAGIFNPGRLLPQG